MTNVNQQREPQAAQRVACAAYSRALLVCDAEEKDLIFPDAAFNPPFLPLSPSASPFDLLLKMEIMEDYSQPESSRTPTDYSPPAAGLPHL